MTLAVSVVGWLAIGIGVVIAGGILVAIAFYPRDNSF